MPENNKIGSIVFLFIALLLGIVFIQAIGNNVAGNTQLSSKVNEQITITDGVGATDEDDVVGLSFFGNNSNNTNDSTITVGTDVNFTRAGAITVTQNLTPLIENQTIFANGIYDVSYTYEGNLFVADSTSQTLLNLVVLFFALFILLIAYLGAKKFIPDLF